MLRGGLSNAHLTHRSSVLPWLSPGNGSSPALTEFRTTRRTFRPSDFPAPLASSATTPRPVSEIPVGDYVLYPSPGGLFLSGGVVPFSKYVQIKKLGN